MDPRKLAIRIGWPFSRIDSLEFLLQPDPVTRNNLDSDHLPNENSIILAAKVMKLLIQYNHPEPTAIGILEEGGVVLVCGEHLLIECENSGRILINFRKFRTETNIDNLELFFKSY